jgi:AraC family transcriptional regulator
MEWLQRLNSAISYIEDNLMAEIDYDEVARKAMCSSYHFQRMFSFITGVPISEYIRRRRLTLAAFELQSSNIKIIDLAFKYGYDSPNSFTRAFQNLHGVTPTSARDKGVQLKAYPCMSFHISIKGDVEMNYRVEQKEAFSVFGVDTIVSAIDGKCYQQIPEFWLNSVNNGTMEKILRAAGNCTEITIKGDMFGNHEMLLNGALYGHNSKDGTFRYLICQNIPKSGISDEFIKLDIPALTWAVFPTDKVSEEEITEKTQTTWGRIYSEWFQTSGYEHADAPELEVYKYAENDKFVAEVWIPIVKK